MKLKKLIRKLSWLLGVIKTLQCLNYQDCTLDCLLKRFPGEKPTLMEYLREWQDSALIRKKYKYNNTGVTKKTPYFLRGTDKLEKKLNKIIDLIKTFLFNTLNDHPINEDIINKNEIFCDKYK